ncbi:MAG: ThuA domain-containing protein [Bacteroidales bacterium]|nr:ThuA domain-containing protein [Bacteroidales bacterium]
MKNKYLILILAAMLIAFLPSCNTSTGIKTLIITGQNEYNWMVSSEAVKNILDETGLFSTKLLLTPPSGEDISVFNPNFSKYELIVVDYHGAAWPEKTSDALMEFINSGGGVVLYNPKSEPFIQLPDSVSVSGRNSFEVRNQITSHPVTDGLPVRWFHPNDIIVRGLKLAGEGVQVLASAAEGGQRGARNPEPVIAVREAGKGRIFATMLGSPDDNENQALHCAGFIVTLQRGAEWAATGLVTQEVPSDFPTAAGAVLRPDFKAIDFTTAFENLGSYEITASTKYFTWLQSQIRKASDDKDALLKLEVKMVEVLKSSSATVDAKRLILKELSWMGSEYCLPAVKELSSVEELKDQVDFTLERLN